MIPLLECRSLDVEVAGRLLVEGLTFSARAGRFVALLGRNGAGKTLTLHSLAGLRSVQRGQVLLQDKLLRDWPPTQRARRMSLLPQASEDPFPVTVLETALIGRHPHVGFWAWESDQDIAIVRRHLAAVDLAASEHRIVDSLSGGERRRLAIATLLAQDPAICLLDEPTNHLDPLHQLAVLRLFRHRADTGGTVVASLHDATLTARFADDVLLLHGDGRWAFGPCEEVLTETSLSELYGSPVHEIAWQKQRVFVAG